MTVRQDVRRLGVWVTASVLLATAGWAGAVNNGLVPVNTPASARRMIEDLTRTFPERYARGPAFLKRLEAIEAKLKKDKGDSAAGAALAALIREASLANPLLDFDKLLVLRRTREANRALNSHTSDTIKRTGWDNDIVELSDLRGKVKVREVYRHANESIMKHVDLHFDADRLLFSGVGRNGKWAVLEVGLDGRGLRELTPDDQPDVQWFDACYLPESPYIVTGSTAGMQGLPCENGGKPMVNLYRVNTRTKAVRQLTFEQDSDWHPRVHANGQVVYLRWEYTDTPHYYSRYLFHMNPDGTAQMELWGSGSYFPTAFVWPRPVPGPGNRVVGVVSGHHAKSETGRLLLIDPDMGRKYPMRHRPSDKVWGKEKASIDIHPQVMPASVTGCVQEIPGWGRDVVGNVRDNQGGGQKYTFGSPWPLSEKYFLVSMRGFGEAGRRRWTIVLVDVFDNMTTIHADAKYSLFEPIPRMPRPTPPVLADRTIDGAPMAVYCSDIHGGRGLAGIPRGKVKRLRVFSYHFGYIRSGGHESCGLEAGWDIKRILGTVPVEADGSFYFRAPANTPLAIQPLDANGAALAIMRSWMVGMPGEILSCNGCHEDHSEVTPIRHTLATGREPREITPWHGPARPVAFVPDVQPVLAKYCVGCHNETDKARRGGISFEKCDPKNWRRDRSYLNLVAFVRHPGPESDLDLFNPMEWHASTSPLVQMLAKGHHGVKLDRQAWDRLYTWIDLNTPHRGMWSNARYEKRRIDLSQLYAGVSANPEAEHRQTMAAYGKRGQIKPIVPPKRPKPKPDGLTATGWPFDAARAKALQGGRARRKIDLGGGQTMQLVRIPRGQFVMGSRDGFPDEAPRARVAIAKAFWMGDCEVTNAQYERFDPAHDTRYLDEHGKDHSVPGYIANHADQPVARVSWREATAFCAWLGRKLGATVALPTEAQWEWAARAGTETPFAYGGLDANFSEHANLADASRRRTYVRWDGGSRIHLRRDYPANYLYPLRDGRFTDNWFVVDFVGRCRANPWGLHDMAGNVCEWTRSSYRPYPYADADGRNAGKLTEKKVARGGSWNDRPKTATSSVRFAYEPYQKVYNVGFRIIVED